MTNEKQAPKVIEIYNLESIRQMRMSKREELKESKKRMITIGQELFNPPQSKSKMDSMMNHVNAGIAAYDGIMTGMKILQRVRRFFRRSKRY